MCGVFQSSQNTSPDFLLAPDRQGYIPNRLRSILSVAIPIADTATFNPSAPALEGHKETGEHFAKPAKAAPQPPAQIEFQSFGLRHTIANTGGNVKPFIKSFPYDISQVQKCPEETKRGTMSPFQEAGGTSKSGLRNSWRRAVHARAPGPKPADMGRERWA